MRNHSKSIIPRKIYTHGAFIFDIQPDRSFGRAMKIERDETASVRRCFFGSNESFCNRGHRWSSWNLKSRGKRVRRAANTVIRNAYETRVARSIDGSISKRKLASNWRDATRRRSTSQDATLDGKGASDRKRRCAYSWRRSIVADANQNVFDNRALRR